MSYVVVVPQKRGITVEDLKRYLTYWERVSYASLSNSTRRQMWFLERVAAKKAIRLYFQKTKGILVPWASIEIMSSGNNKPIYRILKGHLRDVSRTNISLSHVQHIAIGGISHTQRDGSLGVHIERVRNFKRDFLKAFLTVSEQKEIKRYKLPERRRLYATAFWSIKEAYLKSKTTQFHPKEIEIVRKNKDLFEIHDPVGSKVPSGIARYSIPQKGFVASEVYIK